MRFEWDEKKERQNIEKHGIDFTVASYVFADKARIEYFDTLHSDEEDRYIVIGKVRDVLYVVYTERGDRTRIISARRATKKERRLYDYGSNCERY